MKELKYHTPPPSSPQTSHQGCFAEQISQNRSAAAPLSKKFCDTFWMPTVEGFYPQCKVYSDGSHYIAIPHTEKPYKPRQRKLCLEATEQAQSPNVLRCASSSQKVLRYFLGDVEVNEYGEEIITVKPLNDNKPPAEPSEAEKESAPPIDDALLPLEKIAVTGEMPKEEEPEQPANTLQLNERRMTKKELFNELYQEYLFLKKRERRGKLIAAMRPYFKTEKATETYVDSNLERKKRNLICRRVRMTRKANLADFNYFCTFTYDGKKHTEESFKKKLKICFNNMSCRKGWKYMGVWERSPEKHRLHFHGLFHIPQGEMLGGIEEHRDYSTITHKMQTIYQNTYFNEHFGRSDFEEIVGNGKLGEALAYLMKYIEKTGEKIIYSKGLPQYFMSDIMDADVASKIGQEERKLLLYDDFICWDEGTLMGQVSPDVIEKMKKGN